MSRPAERREPPVSISPGLASGFREHPRSVVGGISGLAPSIAPMPPC